MRHWKLRELSSALFFLAAFCPQNASFAEAPGEVIVQMSGFHSDRGKAFVALWRTADHFPGVPPPDTPARVVPIVGRTAEARFTDVPPGSFAITVFHDEDGDAQLKENIVGVPKEGIGFSRNVKPRFRAPRYREAELALEPGEHEQVAIRMLYL